VIPGADHFYAGTTDALWAVVERWLMRESTRQ